MQRLQLKFIKIDNSDFRGLTDSPISSTDVFGNLKRDH